MTTLHASAAGASARYYTRYLAEDGPDSQGRWVGRQAAALGLTGTVDVEELTVVLEGRDPGTGTRLGSPLVDRLDARGRVIPAVAGFDATFSAPKSVSVWWALTGDPRVAEAHDVAVAAVLEHLERFGATTRMRVGGRRLHPEVEGLTMAAFRQATSREEDPQLHTHVVISTKVRTADGRWWALDARYLKRKQRALGGLYQSVLRAELTARYGVGWGPIDKGQAELAGAPPELLEVFSKRAAQVNEATAGAAEALRRELGRDLTTRELAQLGRDAARDTRLAKTHTPLRELVRRWRDEAAALGWSPSRLTQAVQDAGRRHQPAGSVPSVAEVLERLTAGSSTWTRADVLQAICDLTPPVSRFGGRDWARALEQATDRVLSACTTLDPPAAGPTRAGDGRSEWLAPVEPHLTHPEVLAQEQRILDTADRAHATPGGPSATVAVGGLDVLQAAAARAVAGTDPLVLVVGPAGAGKTRTLRAATADLTSHRRSTVGVAPTAKAAKVLAVETGLSTGTVAKLLHTWAQPAGPEPAWRLPAGTTVIVDEAGMLGTDSLDRLLGLAVSQRWRLVLVGDPAQLGAVGRGGMFAQLCATGPAHHLTTIHRFTHPWEQTASLRLRAGDPGALAPYLAAGRVTPGGLDDLFQVAADTWLDETAAGRTIAITAETNAHVDQLNATIQTARRQRGQLGMDAVPIGGGERAHVGDVVVTRRNHRGRRTERGEPVRNRDTWTVTAIGADGSITVSHTGGHGSVALPADYAGRDVRLGYAATAHGHQGDTTDASLTLVTPGTTHRALYVGATRGRHHNQLLVTAHDLDHAIDTLEQTLAADRADIPATAQARTLAQAAWPTPEQRLADARQALRRAGQAARPHLVALDGAVTAHTDGLDRLLALRGEPWWRRRRIEAALTEAVEQRRTRLDNARRAAAPHLAELEQRQDDVRRAQRDLRRHEAIADIAARGIEHTRRSHLGPDNEHPRMIEVPGIEL